MKVKTANVKQDVGELMTPAQVAEAKGIARKNVYRAIRDEKLKSVAIAGVMFVSKQDADAWEPSQSHVQRAKGLRKQNTFATAQNPSQDAIDAGNVQPQTQSAEVSE